MIVLLVDNHRLLSEGLTNLLTAYGSLVAGAAHDGFEALAQAQALRPAFFSQPGCQTAKRVYPPCRV